MRGVSSRIVVSAWAGMVIIVAETPTTLYDVLAAAAMAVKRSFLDHMRLLFDEVDRGLLLRRRCCCGCGCGCVEGRICFYGSKYCSSPQEGLCYFFLSAKGQVWGYSS